MTMTNEEVILKTDVLGRVRVPKAKREQMLDVFEVGDLSAAAFARKHGVHVQTFASWIQKRRRTRGDYENEEVRRQLRMVKPDTPLMKPEGKSAEEPSLTEIPQMNLIEVTTIPQAQEREALVVNLAGGVTVKVSAESQMPLLKSLIEELSC